MTHLYQIPTASVEICHEVKKSKFITRVHPVQDRKDAMAKLEQAKLDYPDARHHCWAYLLGAPSQPQSQAFNDDGEPSGTAGKPILNVLNHGDIGDVMVIVIRYFGGIKLGAGGLVRAYSNATQQTISTVETTAMIAMATSDVNMDFSLENKCRHFVNKAEGQIIAQDYGNTLKLTISLPTDKKSDFEAFCHSLSMSLAWREE